MEGAHIVISDWPVQFLPPTGPLAEEALDNAKEIDVAGFPARVFTPEYLAAIALQTGRAKDKARMLQFVEAGVLDATEFEQLIERHQLSGKWRNFKQHFMSGDSFRFERVWDDKRKMRQRLAAAPIVEKLRMLDALRERALALRNASDGASVIREPAATYRSKPRS